MAWEAWGARGGHHIPAARAPGDTTVGSWCPRCPRGKVSSSRLALGDMVPCSPFGLQGRGVPEQLQLCPQQHSVPWVPSGVASRGGSGTAPQWPYLPCPGRGPPGWGLLSRASPVRRSCPAPNRSPGTLGEAQGESPRHRLAPSLGPSPSPKHRCHAASDIPGRARGSCWAWGRVRWWWSRGCQPENAAPGETQRGVRSCSTISPKQPNWDTAGNWAANPPGQAEPGIAGAARKQPAQGGLAALPSSPREFTPGHRGFLGAALPRSWVW